jgi:hypothetical protein
VPMHFAPAVPARLRLPRGEQVSVLLAAEEGPQDALGCWAEVQEARPPDVKPAYPRTGASGP